MSGRKGSLGGMNRNYSLTSLPIKAGSTGAESGGGDATFSRKMSAPFRPELYDEEVMEHLNKTCKNDVVIEKLTLPTKVNNTDC